ncbi:TetR/AcrR family transcriptional regulator [Martelella alba]|uniref:TetR/AcrR family transcriptional regulator n=1 Tax=Martelella alba TaxID=2590451 RepID=A0A506UB42_9HYPH|nr:TetR/AcrR family transcriptional regulator [Martelella alba]TPW30155.1 TetR/AcrR family transcriptional regulator [Martelella alba]
MDDDGKRSGRPRDLEAGQALKDAALALVRGHGYGRVSIAMIAEKAGVARQTLYNRWKTKADLVLDAVFDEANRQVSSPDVAVDLPMRQQLEHYLNDVFMHLRADGDTLRALIAAAQETHGFQTAFRERFVKPREAIVTEFLRHAQQRGELSPARDPALLSAMIHGVFWYNLLNGRGIEAGLAGTIAAEIFRETGDLPQRADQVS